MDVTGGGAAPVFTPIFGFSGITAPQMSVDVDKFKDGTYIYSRNVVKGASAGGVTFKRAASIYDSDFYDWIYSAIYGVDKKSFSSLSDIANSLIGSVVPTRIRRDLLLVQFARVNMSGTFAKHAGGEYSNPVADAFLGVLSTLISVGISGGAFTLTSASAIAGGAGAALGVGGFSMGPFQFASWMPARAWLLHGCIPVNYKSSNDFDANSAGISLMELEVQPEYAEEFSIGPKP